MKRLKLKKEVKVFLVGMILMGLFLGDIVKNYNNVSYDELGNECRGGIVKVCHN